MKNIKLYLFILCVFSTYSIFSQENISSSFIEPIQNEALLREKVFIHLNKTTYFTHENIWFTAYVGEDNNIPSNYTTNLHVNLLNHIGDVVDSKNIFIKKGVGLGDFLLNNEYSTGKYYIQGFTNYMQNFGDENVFIQEVEIINPFEKKEISQFQYTNIYDIQIFPESGYLLEDTENTIGIKALINGKGYPFVGKIINSAGEEITTIEGNKFGMSKCKFIYVKNQTYTAIVNINGTIQKIILAKANKTGIIFSIDNTNTDNIKLTLKTNKETLPNLKNKPLTLVFYRNNIISDAITLSLKNSQKTTQELLFKKSKMLNGVNIVTLFKNNQPIAERKFFVDKSDEQTAVFIEELKTVNDSINYKIRTINSNNKPIATHLSISILPKESKVFYENQNIKSAFLLSPYVKGAIENPSYYFKNTDIKEKEFLDLLLLNQGWSSYSLEEKIREINPKEQFLFEAGFTIHGKIKKYPKGYDIGVLSKKNRLVAYSIFNENKEFSFENVFVYKNDSIKIALIKKNQLLVKPNGVAFKEVVTATKNYNNLTNRYKFNNIIDKKLSAHSQSKNVLNYIQYLNAELLDEIVLKTKVVKKKELTIYDIEMDLAKKHNMISSGSYKNKKVTKQMETIYQTPFDYFRSLGFIKVKGSNDYFIALRNAPATLGLGGGNINPNNTFPPLIYVNDISTNQFNDIEMLQEIRMVDVDEILINRSGAGGGVHGTGGVIRIYLKKGNHHYFGEESKNLYKSLVMLTGFDRATDYFKPLYNIDAKETFNWTEIDWRNSLQTNDDGEVFIKIPINKISNEFQFIVNGFSENGLLFYDIHKTGQDDF